MKPSKWIGFGFDYRYRDRYPLTLTGLVDRFRSRLSHVSIVGLPTIDAARAFRSACAELPLVHHLSNVAPGSPDGVSLFHLRQQDAISSALGARWCGEDLGIWSLGPYPLPYFTPPLMTREAVEVIVAGLAALNEAVCVPFLVETPNCTFVAGDLSLGQVFTEICQRSHCGMVLDASHVYSYALATDTDPKTVLEELPMDYVLEVHVAGGHVDPEHGHRYVDTHSDPVVPAVWDLFKSTLARANNLRAITYEIGNRLTLDQIEADFAVLESIAEEAGFEPRLDAA